NADEAVGLAYLGNDNHIYFRKAGCSAKGLKWSPLSKLPGLSKTSRVSLAAYGQLFAVAVQGYDNFPYFMIEEPNKSDPPYWPGFERVETGDGTVALMEPPTVLVFRGMIIVAGRDTTGALRYWIRNPNFLLRPANSQTWVGGRIVGGWGVGAIPPAFASIGRKMLSNEAN